MKTFQELSRMIAWLVVAGFLFFSGLYFYDSVREYRQEKFSFDRQISELQAQNKAQDARIIELQEMVKQQNLKIDSIKPIAHIKILNRQDKCEQDIIKLFTITCLLYLLIAFGGIVIYRLSKLI